MCKSKEKSVHVNNARIHIDFDKLKFVWSSGHLADQAFRSWQKVHFSQSSPSKFDFLFLREKKNSS